MSRVTLYELAKHCQKQNQQHINNKDACLHCVYIEYCSQYARFMSKIEPRYWAPGDRTLPEDILFSETAYYMPEKE